jgi:hypothetical protein
MQLLRRFARGAHPRGARAVLSRYDGDGLVRRQIAHSGIQRPYGRVIPGRDCPAAAEEGARRSAFAADGTSLNSFLLAGAADAAIGAQDMSRLGEKARRTPDQRERRTRYRSGR